MTADRTTQGGFRAITSWMGRWSSVIGHRSPVVSYEQAVYGNFAFWDRGYAILARSPGCRPEWLVEFQVACQNLGERPAGVADFPGMFALRLASGPWAVVGFSPQGCDDRGRPGALAFHGLFLTPREYRKIGCDPFAIAGALRGDWPAEAQDQPLPAGSWTVREHEPEPEADPRAPEIVRELLAGRPVALETPEPIEGLAMQVWRALPVRVRARRSVATWTFGNANRFDLLAAPRLAGFAPEVAAFEPRAGRVVTEAPAPRRSERRSPGPWVAFALAATLAVAGVTLALRGGGDDEIPAPAPPVVVAEPPPPPKPKPAPPPPSFARPGGVVPPEERRRVAEALMVMAERFGVKAGSDAPADPGLLMERIARELRYRGPMLADADRDALGRDPSRDAELALRWDALIRRFADDRPLPEGFRRAPLSWQLGVFAWSFHQEADAALDRARSPAEVAQALGESLAVDMPLRPTALSARHPALASYLAFLSKLPRR